MGNFIFCAVFFTITTCRSYSGGVPRWFAQSVPVTDVPLVTDVSLVTITESIAAGELAITREMGCICLVNINKSPFYLYTYYMYYW